VDGDRGCQVFFISTSKRFDRDGFRPECVRSDLGL